MNARRAVLPLLAFVCVVSLPVSGNTSSSVLAISVEPPLGPDGKPWRVQLLAPGDVAPEVVAEEPSRVDRPLELRTLPDRPYLLRLFTDRGDVWMTDAEPFVVGTSKARLLEPKAEAVRGSVVVGKRPLANARLTFSTDGRKESVSLAADEAGLVSGVLPRLGSWNVAVSSEVPRLHREVDADVLRNNRGNELDFEIALIPRGIEGEFVDPEGERITSRVGLHIFQRTPAPDHRDEHFEGGTFRVEWLGEGEYVVEAGTSYLHADGDRRVLWSEPFLVTVAGGTADPAWHTVVMRRPVGVRGRVVAANGAGVPGARVYRVGSRLEYARYAMDSVTDADGRFVLPLPEKVEETCIVVAAEGLSVALTRILPTTDEVLVPVEGPGGTLVLDQPYPRAKSLDGRVVSLFRKGCVEQPFAFTRLIRFGPGNWPVDTGTRFRYTLQQFEPGPYSLCAVPLADLVGRVVVAPPLAGCVEGTLPPGGRLDLTLLP